MGYENFNAPAERSTKPEHPIIVRMHGEAHRILKEDAVDPLRFVNLYGKENVTRDLRKVEEIKTHFETDESKRAAEIFEAIMHQHVELSNWLGPHAETIRASEFDDIINGIDLIVEFNENDSTRHLALGIDVTFGSYSMQKKFDRIKSEIHADKLATVKYFEAHGFQGSLIQTPRVVIGVDIAKVIALAGLWERKENKALSTHIAKDIIADEIERQLRTFLLYAQNVNAENAVKSYTRAYNTFRNLYIPENGFAKNRSAIVAEDRVHQSIVANLRRFQQPSRGT